MKKSKNRSIRELEHAANNGDIASAFQLSDYYRDGQYVEQDSELAKKYEAVALQSFSNLKLEISSIKLTGFGPFKSTEVPLCHQNKCGSNLTVFVGINGAGKTSILDAIAKCLSWLILRITKTKASGSGDGIEEYEIYHGSKGASEYASVVTEICLNKNLLYKVHLSKSRDGSPRTRKNDVKDIGYLGENYKRANTSIPNFNLPLISYYPVERTLGFSKGETNKILGEIGDTGDKLDAYYKSLNAAVDFLVFFKWFKYQDEMAKLETGLVQQSAKKAVTLIIRTIQSFLPELQDLRVQRSPELDLIVDKNEVALSVRQLSQGEKSLFSLVVDIAQRLLSLNPSLDDPLLGTGVVLIDEIDLHLHPRWQQTVIPRLTETFPNLQFIITTHSPQVLSTVRREQIRTLGKNSEGHLIAEIPPKKSYGVPSNDVLQAIMGTDPQPPIPEKKDLDELTQLVDQGLYDKENANRLLEHLQRNLGDCHPQLLKIERSIRRQKALKI